MIKIPGKIGFIGKYGNVLMHTGFWILSFKVLFDLFREGEEILKVDIIYTTVFLFTMMIPVYINLKILIPLLFSKGKYLLYFLCFTALVVLGAYINYLSFDRLIDYVFTDYYFISYYEFSDLIKFIFVFLVVSSLIKLSKSWFFLSETEKKLAMAEKEKIGNELLALKAQINPHFMFNSLNNIYSLALKKSDQAPGAIIQLGNILRYVIYRGSEEKVRLDEEIQILRQFIELQQLRVKDSKIKFEVVTDNTQIMISPLIFLPLIENGFKHGLKSDTKNAFLDINLKANTEFILFRTLNNKGKATDLDDDKFRGIGLDNVRRRLELCYPGKYELIVQDFEASFQVELKIFYNDQP